MIGTEQLQHIETDPQRLEVTRRGHGLRAVVATLLVVGLVAAIVSEMPFGASTSTGGERAAPALPPSMEWGISPGPTSPEELQVIPPVPPSTIVG
jgi:hypothetical protein